jgi:hypothetical protein
LHFASMLSLEPLVWLLLYQSSGFDQILSHIWFLHSHTDASMP